MTSLSFSAPSQPELARKIMSQLKSRDLNAEESNCFQPILEKLLNDSLDISKSEKLLTPLTSITTVNNSLYHYTNDYNFDSYIQNGLDFFDNVYIDSQVIGQWKHFFSTNMSAIAAGPGIYTSTDPYNARTHGDYAVQFTFNKSAMVLDIVGDETPEIPYNFSTDFKSFLDFFYKKNEISACGYSGERLIMYILTQISNADMIKYSTSNIGWINVLRFKNLIRVQNTNIGYSEFDKLENINSLLLKNSTSQNREELFKVKPFAKTYFKKAFNIEHALLLAEKADKESRSEEYDYLFIDHPDYQYGEPQGMYKALTQSPVTDACKVLEIFSKVNFTKNEDESEVRIPSYFIQTRIDQYNKKLGCL